MSFELIHSESIHKGRVFSVRRDQVRLPDGNLAYLDIVAHPGAVTLVPVDERGRVWFVRQYRHAVRESLLELPAGTLAENEPPELCAARELREEIGMAAGDLLKIGEFFLAPGYSSEHMHVYLATRLRADPMQHDTEEFLAVEPIPIERAFVMAEDGRIRDAKSLTALLLARRYLT